jgi:hypothetical protein
MSKTRPNTVQIVNPLPGGARYTSPKSAIQFVRRGRAAFEDGNTSIRFLTQDHRSNTARRSDLDGGHFRWRIGTTGGFAQRIGSIVYPTEKGRRLDKTI